MKHNIFNSILGWIGALLNSLLLFIAPEKYAFLFVLVAIILDAVFGIAVAVRNGKYVLSKLGRITLFKITAYASCLVMVLMFERLITSSSASVGIRIAAGWAVACEFWSMSASILIIYPEAVFFRIMRKALAGEIEAKTGQKIDG